MMRRAQQGFSLVAAIFLLVVVSGLVAYMVSFSTLQQTTVVLSVRGAQAMQAARTGLDYAAYQVLNAGGCGAVSGLDQSHWTAPSLDAFQVSFDCVPSDHTEGATTITVYQITATAESVGSGYTSGSYANPDYIQRTIRANVSLPPP
jgi:MSHA biogenesis protein MshP